MEEKAPTFLLPKLKELVYYKKDGDALNKTVAELAWLPSK